MKGIKKVIYWHRFGQKVYSIPINASPILEKEITSSEIEKIEEGLKDLSEQSVLLLLSDSISYLYEKIIDPPLPVDENFKRKLQDIIKSDIPEDFSEFTWDYKVENDFDGKQKVIIFAPIKEFQTMIDEVSTKLMIKIEAMETESVAATRDPNPILGIMKKPDIRGKDEEILNLSVVPEDENKNKPIKIIGIVGLLVIMILAVIFGLSRLKEKIDENPKQKIATVTITAPSPVPTEVVASESAVEVKEWADLTVMVQNGTSQAGLASKVAQRIIEGGLTDVESGNADNKDYIDSVLIIKSEELKEKYLTTLNTFVKVDSSNIKVDKSIEFDVKFILGINY